MTQLAAPVEYVVHRTVTDKLQDTLNGMAEYYDDLVPTYTGGRDWIVVGSRPSGLADERTPYGNTSQADLDRMREEREQSRGRPVRVP